MKQKLLIIGLLLAGVLVALRYKGKLIELFDQSGEPTNFSAETDSTEQQLAPELQDACPGNRLVKQAAENLKITRPVFSKARFKADLFGVQINGPGQIMLKGQGSGQSRMEFVFSINQIEQRLIQVSDNDLYYFVRQTGDDRTVEYVDLNELAIAQQSPTNSLLSGSLPSLFERLHGLFVFDDPKEEKLGELDVWVSRGTWRKKALAKLLDGVVDPKIFERNDWAQHLPAHLPRQVTLTLANDKTLPLFPYRIEFECGTIDPEHPAMVTLELFDVQPVKDIPAEMFQIHPGIDRPRDRTAFYVERLNRLRR